MRSIATYIEYTLMTSHYAFVPGLGGFLLRDIDASYSRRTYTPSHKEIHYNRFLTKDDGMLANAYMLAEGISYDEAIAQIRFEVAGIKGQLEKKKSVVLGNLGSLSYDSDGHIVVKNAKHYPLDPQNYGFSNLSLRPWKEVQAEMDKLEKNNGKLTSANSDVIEIPRYWLQRVAVILLIILCFFANLSYFTGDNQRKSDYAAIIDTDILFGNSSPNNLAYQSWDQNWEDEITLSEIETQLEQEQIVDVVEEIKSFETQSSPETVEKESVVEEPLAHIEMPTVTSNKIFYIIIASCTSRAEAERVVLKKEADGFSNVGILEKDGRFRLYLKSFTDRTEGETYLEQVRISTPFQKAWLLPVRQESLLSFNYKKLDNDCQLSVELSHPYQRTERDQGWINT